MALTDDQGDVVGTYDYDVFGAVRSHSGTDTEFSFTGEQNDPNGLEYLRARYYDPETGRFISKDPKAGSALITATQNRYPYARSNPCSRRDPTGKASESVYCWGHIGLQGLGKLFSWVPYIGGEDKLFYADVYVKFTKTGDRWVSTVLGIATNYGGLDWRETNRTVSEGYVVSRVSIDAQSDALQTSAQATFVFWVDPSGHGHADVDVDPGRYWDS